MEFWGVIIYIDTLHQLLKKNSWHCVRYLPFVTYPKKGRKMFATGVTYWQGTLTHPDTLSFLIQDLHMLYLLWLSRGTFLVLTKRIKKMYFHMYSHTKCFYCADIVGLLNTYLIPCTPALPWIFDSALDPLCCLLLYMSDYLILSSQFYLQIPS